MQPVALPDANGYISVADADAFFATSFGASAWGALTATEKQVALTEASRALDKLPWWGEKCGTAQQWAWPRKMDAVGSCPAAVCTVLPTDVEAATALLALSMHQEQGALVPAVGTSGSSTAAATGAIKRQKLGDLEQEFFSPHTSKAQQQGLITDVMVKFPWLRDHLSCWTVPPPQPGQARVLTRGAGTDSCGGGCRRLDGLPFPVPYPVGLSDSSRMLPTPTGMWGDYVDTTGI